jgi:hypothetical protein
MNKDKMNELLDHLYQAASLADQIKFRIPEIYDLIEIVSEELEAAE